MNQTAKTIQIFLPQGDPTGIRIAEITTRIVQLIEVPRALLPTFLRMVESSQVALYFLFGDTENGIGQQVYIGQSGDLRARLISHSKGKDFWDHALVLISRTNSLTTTHSLFLEWHSLQESAAVGRYQNANGNSGTKPHTPPPLAADCIEIFETGRTLLSTLGYPIFDPVTKSSTEPGGSELFYCKRGGAEGRGLYTSEGFVVLAGSTGRKELARSVVGRGQEQRRNRLIDAGVVLLEGDFLVFQRDYLFKSPSTAAEAIIGASANGWTEWKSSDGKTLDSLKRQSLG